MGTAHHGDGGASGWRIALLLLCGLLLGLGAAGCERFRKHDAPSADAGARPYPELAQVAAAVAEARAILPRLPSDVRPLPLATPQDAAPAPEPRLVLSGEGLLLRPSAFPTLPSRLRVELYLDARSPPGGYLLVADAQGHARWPILDAVQHGSHDGAFADTFRVVDSGARLRYLALLGVPYDAGGQHFRSLEGYLIHPLPGGGVSAEGAIYPLDFGYRHPEPPAPVQAAQAFGERVAALRSATARAEPERSAAELREALLAAYRERAALAEAWIAFTRDNAYLWRTPAERRALYAPLAALGGGNPELEQVFAALHGEADAELQLVRQAMQQALLREREHAPPPG